MLAGIGLLLITSVVYAQGTTLVEQFKVSDATAKRRMINDSLQGRIPANETDVRQLLTAGLSDRENSIREHTIGVIGSILLISLMPKPPAATEWATKWRALALEFRPHLEIALKDPEPRVRVEAVRTVAVSFAVQEGPGLPTLRLPSRLVTTFAGLFDTDPSPMVRAFVVDILMSASVDNPDPEAKQIFTRVLLRALDETEQSVVQAASRSAKQGTVPEALPRLVKQLKHPAYVVRMSVAQAIASFGAEARRYLPELEAALAVETHDITRKTIAGSISVISR